jgi:4-diphosphocytidyl-2-C-methyl-D-erythritol kinase
MRSLHIRAYAKINLGLKIMGKRPDGYHEIDTTFQSIDLADELRLELRSDGEIVLTMEPELGIPAEQNLALQAARLLREQTQFEEGIYIHLSKKIPPGAGLGGGSSDAAAVLAGLNQLCELRLSKEELKALGAELGSDVPFFFEGGRCRGRGLGEILEKLSEDPALEGIGLLLPPFSLSAREVYEAYDRLLPPTPSSPYPNDLEAVALSLRPELRAYRAFLERSSVRFGMSGSGPTFYALIQEPDEQIVHSAQTVLSCEVYMCKPVFSGHEIVGSFKAF